MKPTRKIIAAALLASVIGIQCLSVQSVFAQEYRVLPPVIEEDGQISEPLPNIPSINNINSTLQGYVSTIPAGTTIKIVTRTSVNSVSNQVGEIFAATITDPISLGGNTVIPSGSEVIGQITYIENAGRVGKNARMEVKFTNVKLPNGQKYPISGKVITVDNSGILKGGSLKKQIVKTVGTEAVSTAGGTLAGLTIGSIFGGPGGGAVFGTTAGGFLGLGYILARKGKEVVLPGGTKMNILLEQPLTIGK